MAAKRILHAEDDQALALLVRKAVDDYLDFEVEFVTEESFGGALSALTQGSYDLLILDNQLRRMRNVSVSLIKLARTYQDPMPNVIVYSSGLDHESQREVTDLGAEYILKGTPSHKLLEAVARLLST